MHIGSVHLFEGEVPFEDFVAMRCEMHCSPLQQIIRPDPFNLGHPTWEFDPHFDVRNHIFKLQIDAPAEKRVIECRQDFHADDGSRQAALGHLLGVTDGRRDTAMIARIHHCWWTVFRVSISLKYSRISPEIKPLPLKPETTRAASPET